MGEIKAEQPHHLLAERLLICDGEGTLRDQDGFMLLLFTHLLDEGGQPAGEIAEDLIQPRARHAGFVQRQHGVVGAHIKRLGAKARHFPRQGHHFLQIGGEACPVVVFALAAPGVLALAAREGQGLYQIRGQQTRILPVAFYLGEIGALNVIQRLAFGLGYPVAKLGGCAFVVDQHAEFGHGLGACLVAALRHHGGLIPAADGAEVGEPVQLLLMLFKFLI